MIIYSVVIQNKGQVGMCVHRRFLSVCASAQFDQSLSFTTEEIFDPWRHIECPLKTLIIDCADARQLSESSMGAHANLYLLLDTRW